MEGLGLKIFPWRKKKAENRLTTTKSFLWGKSTAGTMVTESTALRQAAVYSCVRIIAEAIAGLPLHVYKYDEVGTKMAPDHPLYKLLHHKPNPEMTSFSLRETLMTHLLLWGNAYAQIIRENSGRIIALYPLLPDKMDVNRDADGQIYYTYWRDLDEKRRGEQAGMVNLSGHEVIHIPGLSFNGLVGLSPIALAKNTIGLAIATEEYGSGFFANGATPGGILEHPKTLNDHDKIRQTWEDLYKGSGNSHRLAILEEGMTFHQISIPPEQAQFLETRRFQIDEIARIFRVPPHMIGDLEKSSFNNIEQQSMEFVTYTLQPWICRWEQTMLNNLLTDSEQDKYFIKFNLGGLLRGDYETRMKGYSIGIQNGFMSPNDCRRLEDYNLIPSPAGDRYMVNGNMIGIEDVGKQWKEVKSNE
ncbi:MAG: phage portal protein [Clostridiales bacterium]|nr:phage portal protein [Clostridiales bacterium]